LSLSFSFEVSLSSEVFPGFPTFALEAKDLAESPEEGWEVSDWGFDLEEADPLDLLELREDREVLDSASEEAAELVGDCPTFRLGTGVDITPFQWCRLDCLSSLAMTSVLK